jgi:Flp pilus assembly protein TadD
LTSRRPILNILTVLTSPVVVLGVALGQLGYGQLEPGLSAGMSEFSGRLVNGEPGSYRDLSVEITSLNGEAGHHRMSVSPDGGFDFGNLPAGSWRVRVLSWSGEEITSTVAMIGHHAGPFEISLPASKTNEPVSGTVSVQELSHPASKRVRKLLLTGQQLLHDQQLDAAAERFREAIKEDTYNAEAHAGLGQIFATKSEWSAAAEEYRAAVLLSPNNYLLHSNLGAALVFSNHLDEAEAETSKALKLNPGFDKAHFVMAAVLERRGRIGDAVQHLKAAQDTFPTAKKALDKICATNPVAGCQ